MSFTINGTNGLTFPDGSAQAESMTDYGIGAIKSLGSGVDLDNQKTPGIYAFSNPTGTAGTVPSGTYFSMVIFPYASNQLIQLIHCANSGELWIRNLYGTVWSIGRIWDSFSDGNVGQPPAPKATIVTTALAQNAYTTITAAANKQYLAVCWNGTVTTAAAISLVVAADTAAYATTIVAASGTAEITTNGLDVRFTNKHATTSNVRSLLFQIGW